MYTSQMKKLKKDTSELDRKIHETEHSRLVFNNMEN